MKRRCQFLFFGEEWTCERISGDPELGGSINSGNRLLKLNASFDPSRFRCYVHHELLEEAIGLAGCIYTRQFPDNDTMYLMDHRLMDLVSTRVVTAYNEIVRKMCDGTAKLTRTKKKSSKPSATSEPGSSPWPT